MVLWAVYSNQPAVLCCCFAYTASAHSGCTRTIYSYSPCAALPVWPFLQPNVGRYTTGVWTRQFLEQQLRMVLAGRAAEELVYGLDEMSSLHQHKLMMARQVTALHQSACHCCYFNTAGLTTALGYVNLQGWSHNSACTSDVGGLGSHSTPL